MLLILMNQAISLERLLTRTVFVDFYTYHHTVRIATMCVLLHCSYCYNVPPTMYMMYSSSYG